MWIDWARGTLFGVGAPADAVNLDTLWAWSNAESDPYLVMHIDNPLDTTWWEPGATAWNNLPSGGHVWVFPSEAEGIDATVKTLLDGSYPLIVDHLRRSVPRQLWGDACAELGTWGTGCGWIGNDYGAVPGYIAPPTPAPAAISNTEENDVNVQTDEALNIFERGTDNALWQRRFDGAAWSPWVSLGGNLLDPAVVRVVRTPSKLYVFVVGMDRAQWYRVSTDNGVTWQPWQSAGGIESGPVTV